MTWKDKIFGNGSGLHANRLYLATFEDGEETEDGKVKFKYAVQDARGQTVYVNRSIKNDRHSLKSWMKGHTAFDESDSEMTKLTSAHHLVLIKKYEGHAFVQKVFPLETELLSDE